MDYELEKRYFLVTHKYTGERYRAWAYSKTKLKRTLPRFLEGNGYLSLWTIVEVDEKKYRKMSHLKDAPYHN